MEMENLNLGRPMKKLTDKCIGPYPITEMVSSHALRLKLPKTVRIHPVVNIMRVRPYVEPRILGQGTIPPPPVVINGEKEYEVEEVLDSRMR